MHVLEKFQYCPVCGSKHFVEQTEKSKRCESCGFEYFLNPSSAVAAFILNEKGELLVTQRRYDPGKGTLDLPGGFCDIGETVLEALRREVKEETNLEIQDVRYFCCEHNQSLRIKGNRGKRKECNYLEYHHLAFSYYFEGKQERASNGRSSVTKS